MPRFLIAGLLALYMPLAWSAEPPRDPYEYFFEPTLGDLQEELEIAAEEGKKGVLLFFEMDECPFCHRMKDTVLNQVAVQDYFREHVKCISMDIEGDVDLVDFAGEDTTQKEFASKNRVRATPVFAFYDLEGNQVIRYTGATAGVDEFLLLGQFFVEKHYQLQDKNGRHLRFSRYKRLMKKQAQ